MRRSTVAGFLGIFALVMGMLAAPSMAQEGGDGPAILLILDASGSMNRIDDNGVELIDGAQEALVRLIESIPEGITVGLRVYGHRVPNTDKPNGCRDTELIVPPGPLDREVMVKAIRSFSAKGFTPIGLSLQEAAADLELLGGGTIVLVSDGEDTCAPPPPCEVAADLIAEGYRIQVHSVGFLLEEGSPARDQLRCIAEATGGSYGEVYEIDFLTSEVGRIVSEAVPEGNYHIPFDGAAVRIEAPLLSVSQPLPEQWGQQGTIGLYSTRIRPGETRWYRLELDGGKDIDVGSGIWPDFFTNVPEGEAFEVLIEDADGNDVRKLSPVRQPWRIEVASVSDWEEAGLAASTRTEVFLWEHLDDEGLRNARRQGFTEETYARWANETYRGVEPHALDPGTYYVGLVWDSTRSPDVQIGLDFSVLVHEVDYSEFQQVDRVPLQGGSTIRDAALLELQPFDPFPFPPYETDPASVGSFAATIEPGETLWYTLHVSWDEDVHVDAFLHRSLDTPTAPGETFGVRIFAPGAAEAGPDAPGVEINPGRPGAIIPLDDDSALRHDEPRWLPRPEATLSSSYLGRSSPPPEGPDGPHYVAITWDSPIGAYEAEVEFAVDLTSRCPEKGCGPAERPTAQPELVEPATQAPAAPPPATSVTEQPSGTVAAPPAGATGRREGSLLWIGAGAALVILAGGAFALRRRRI